MEGHSNARIGLKRPTGIHLFAQLSERCDPACGWFRVHVNTAAEAIIRSLHRCVRFRLVLLKSGGVTVRRRGNGGFGPAERGEGEVYPGEQQEAERH